MWMPLYGTGLAVRMDLLNEEQAMRNHGQALATLAQRGGLAPSEALAIAEHRQWQATRSEIDALKMLARHRDRGAK